MAETKRRIARYGTPEAEGMDSRYIIGKPHPDRARQFMPFAALKGYDALVESEAVSEKGETLHYESVEDHPECHEPKSHKEYRTNPF